MDPRPPRLLRTLRLGAVLAGVVLGAPALALQPCAGFGDVDVDDPLCASVDWIRNRSITLGCAPAQGTSLYCPAADVARAQMAAFAWRLAHALMPQIATRDETRAPVDLDAAVPACVTAIAPSSSARRASVDAVIAAIGPPAVRFVAEVVHTLDGGVTFVPTVALALPAATPQGGGWTNVRVRGTLVIPAGVSAQVATRARRDVFAGQDDLVQGQCTLRVSRVARQHPVRRACGHGAVARHARRQRGVDARAPVRQPRRAHPPRWPGPRRLDLPAHGRREADARRALSCAHLPMRRVTGLPPHTHS